MCSGSISGSKVAVQLAGIGYGAAGYSRHKVSVVEIKAGEAYEQRELTPSAPK